MNNKEAINNEVGSVAQPIPHKSPQSKIHGQTNLPQIFKKDQKESKQIRPGSNQFEMPMKTIFKHDPVSSQNYASVPAQTSQMYTNMKQSPESSQHQIQFNAQHTSSKSHEPKDRQSKSESAQKLLKESITMPGAQTTANSVIGHNS